MNAFVRCGSFLHSKITEAYGSVLLEAMTFPFSIVANGVNSITKDGLHIPLLDLDECNLSQCIDEVKELLTRYRLGKASICSTGRQNSFHVYIWNKVSWRKAIEIVSSCKLIDLKHLQFSLRRGHFTLRISDKKSRSINLLCNVFSPFETTAEIKDLKSFVTYETASKLEVK